MVKYDQNGPKWSKLAIMTKMVKNGKNGLKVNKIVKNCKIDQNRH